MEKVNERLSLMDTQEESIAQSKALVEYVVEDLEEIYSFLNDNTKARVNRCLTALTMLSNQIDNIKAISFKSFNLERKEVA